ncbi:MAG: hypothetical protein WA705_03085 [Candidatus Ozemobacteraceae bacterium]
MSKQIDSKCSVKRYFGSVNRQFFRQQVVWTLLLVFVSQIAFAEVVPTAPQSKRNTPAIQGEIVPNGPQSGKTPAISGEIVPSGPRSGQTPAISGEIVPSGSLKREIVPSGVLPRGNAPDSIKTPAVTPFVGEAVVGISMLIAYGPQIIALAGTVAMLAASIAILVNSGKQSLEMVKSIGAKLKNMLMLLLGPLALSSGTAKESVEGLSAQLLRVTKSVTNSVSTPVDQLQGQVDKTLAMSRDLESMTIRGRSMAETMKGLSAETQSDLKKIVAGGEVQTFRDGAGRVAARMGSQADVTAGAFNQAAENTHLTTAQLEALKTRIDGAVTASGKNAGEASLYDIGLSGAEISKQLIDARKHMVDSRNVLTSADKASAGLHTEILALLNGVKGDLETFAAANGVDAAALAKTMKDPKIQGLNAAGGTGASSLGIKADSGKSGEPTTRLSDEISFMIEDMARLNAKTEKRLQTTSTSSEGAARAVSSQKEKTSGENPLDALYQKKVAAYKTFVGVMTRNPGDKKGIEQAQSSFEAADQAYRAAEEKR